MGRAYRTHFKMNVYRILVGSQKYETTRKTQYLVGV
jgi:hypothetical protein